MVGRVWKRKTRSKNWSDTAGGDKRSSSDSGAAVVEMAFIFGVLIMLLVGVVTSAVAFGQNNSIENAAREASRYGAALAPIDPSTRVNNAWLASVRDVARSAAQGNLDAGVDGQYICVAHIGVAGAQKLEDDGVVEDYSPGRCFDDGLSESRVQIETGRASEISAALFSIDVNLNAQTSARYERVEQ